MSVKISEPIINAAEKDSLYLSPDDVRDILHTSPETLRHTAKEHPERIGFPFMFSGKRMIIPKIPFFEFLGLKDLLIPDSQRRL